MVVAHVCESCQGVSLPGLGQGEPDHCYGSADRPAPEGVLGGYKCACDCRGWDPIKRLTEPHAEHDWEAVGPCVYCKPCRTRLYQGDLPESKDPGRKARQEACQHEWDQEMGQGFYFLCEKCGFKEWTV